MKHHRTLALAAALAVGMSPPVVTSKKVWDFETDEAGKIAEGFTNEVGTWVITKDGENHVLAQTARSDDDTFNVVLAEATSYKDLDLRACL